MGDNTLKAIHAHISGRVQGVGFRYSTLGQAKRRALCGYVRNLPDGRVEVVAEGNASDIESLVFWLKKGPPGAHVQDMSFRYISLTKTYRNFTIAY